MSTYYTDVYAPALRARRLAARPDKPTPGMTYSTVVPCRCSGCRRIFAESGVATVYGFGCATVVATGTGRCDECATEQLDLLDLLAASLESTP